MRIGQGGFTLVEIAVVLVIAGLLLGGVLQGHALIQSMRVKDIVVTVKDLGTASQQFKDRYRYLPGDWVFVANEIPNVIAGGNGNGIIDTPAESANAANHLFNAGFIRLGAAQMRTHYGAVRMLGNAAAAGSIVAGGANPLPRTTLNIIEFTNLPCEVALEVDLKLDDGDLARGSSRASVAACLSGTLVPGFATPL